MNNPIAQEARRSLYWRKREERLADLAFTLECRAVDAQNRGDQPRVDVLDARLSVILDAHEHAAQRVWPGVIR